MSGASGHEEWRYLHADALGSPERVSDGGGAAIEEQSFNAWVTLVRGAGLPGHLQELLLHMDNASFAELWRAKVFRGEAADEPPKVASGNLAAEYVGRTSGGITFMAARSVPPGLKILSVDGKLPGQPGYALNKDSRQ